MTCNGFVVILVICASLLKECEGACPEPCTCLYHQVNCSSRGLSEISLSNVISLPGFIEGRNFTTLLADNNNISSLVDLPYPHLKQLYLNNNNITSIRPKVLQQLENLTELNLNHNEILDIEPKTFLNNKHLISLYLSHNNISQLNNDTFSGLISLRDLFIEYNAISYIDIHAFNTTPLLRKLLLNGNKMLKLPASGPMFISESVKWLELENCAIPLLPQQTFQEMPNLIYINLRNNGLQKESLISLRQIRKLQYLNLKQNSITLVHPEMFSEISLLSLYLRGNPLYLARDQPFLNAPSLSTLDMSACEIKNIPENFLKTCPNLQVLKANQNKLSQFKSSVIADYLETLDLSDNYLTTLDNETFNAFPNLRHLALSRNRIKSIHVEAFKHNEKLVSLDLQRNPLLVVENQVLVESPSLNILDMSDCNIPILSCSSLHTGNLTKLILSYNKLKILDVKCFRRLKYLDVAGNGISDLKGEDLSGLASLDYLDINNNPLDCDRVNKTWFWCYKTRLEIRSRCGYLKNIRGKTNASKNCKIFSSRIMEPIDPVNESDGPSSAVLESERVEGSAKENSETNDEISRFSVNETEINSNKSNFNITLKAAGVGSGITLYSIIYVSVCAVLLLVLIFLISIAVDCYRSHHRQDTLIRKASEKTGVRYDAVPDEIDGQPAPAAGVSSSKKNQAGNFRRQRRKNIQNESRKRDSVASSTRLPAEHPRYMSNSKINDDISEPTTYAPHNLWTQQFRDLPAPEQSSFSGNENNVWPARTAYVPTTPPFPRKLPDSL